MILTWDESMTRRYPKHRCPVCRKPIRVGHHYHWRSMDPMSMVHDIHTSALERAYKENGGDPMTTEQPANVTEAKVSEPTVNPETKGEEKIGGLLERSRKCPECGHENPISRVTCLKCSARLFKPTKRDEAKLISKKAKKILEKKAEEKTEMKKAKKATAAKPKKVGKAKGTHDNQKLRDCFAKKGTWTMGELKKATGFDEDHIRYTLNVFRNKNRTKDPLFTDYDKEKETFKLEK